MSQNIFKRYEKKYVISESVCWEIKAALSEYMEEDNYGSYTIYNIYYYTEKYDLIRSSLEKPAYKEKLRLRSYGRPTNGKAFLELKKKFEGTISIRDKSGTTLGEITTVRNYQAVIISSPELKLNETYSLYSGETKLSDITISNTITSVSDSGGTVTGGFGGQGMMPGGGKGGRR